MKPQKIINSMKNDLFKKTKINRFKRRFKYLRTYLFTILILIMLSTYIIFDNSKLREDKKHLNDTIEQQDFMKDSILYEYDKMKLKLDSIEKINDELKSKRELYLFLDKIAFRESSGNQYEVNEYGMLGLYQFNPRTLEFLGYNVNKQEYLSCVKTQNDAMLDYLKFNKGVLQKYIKEYDGKYYKGVYITSSGLLAGAHLTGAGGVIEFFDDTGKYKEYDGNNIHVSEYIQEFSGYDIMAFLN